MAKKKKKSAGTRKKGRAATPVGRAKTAKRTSPASKKPRRQRVDGYGAQVVLTERVGGEEDKLCNACDYVAPLQVKRSGPAGRVGGAKRSAGSRPKLNGGVCRALAALGCEVRSRIMNKLLAGPATYKALQKVTKLQAGPLYHHVNQLRLAGLLLPKQRDLYELTRGGRNLLLGVLALAPLIRDSRRRSIPSD